MDGLHRFQDGTEIHTGEIAYLPEARWLALFLLLYARDGDFRVDELAERLGDLGFGALTPGELHKTMQQLKEEGLLEEDPPVPDGDPSGTAAEGYGLTLAGESYLHAWGDYLERYEKELGHLLRLYKGGQDAHTSLDTMRPSGGSEGREGTGTVFVLTSSGLRHMGLRPVPGRPNATGRGFLGYLQEEIFWRDALELVHEDDLPLLRFLISLVMEEPGASESVEVRFRDAWGGWVLMDVCVLNVLEAPTGQDTGLLVVNVRQTRESTLHCAETRNGSHQTPR
jgi:hypothetical protein